jgi:hypothetical protein
MRGFAAGLAAFDDQDACTFLAEFNREREADDAAADDDDVPVLHFRIVEESSS